MKGKCTRVKCKEKESTHGQTRISFKGHLSKTRWVVLASWSSPMEMHMKDNLLTTEPVEMGRWLRTQVTPMRANLWTISSKGKESSTWRMETYTKDNFSKENGTAVARFSFLMRPLKRAYGCRTRSNDILCSLIIFLSGRKQFQIRLLKLFGYKDHFFTTSTFLGRVLIRLEAFVTLVMNDIHLSRIVNLNCVWIYPVLVLRRKGYLQLLITKVTHCSLVLLFRKLW